MKADLTYNGTSGWSGSETSKQRALTEDASGKTAHVQQSVLHAVAAAGFSGVTVAELRDLFPGNHHGSISGALTNLHRAGRIMRLSETRDRCKIYVLPDFIDHREFEVPKQRVDWKSRAEKLQAENAEMRRRIILARNEMRKWQTRGQMIPLRTMRQILD